MLELLTSEEQCQKFLTALRKLDNNTLSTTSEKMEILEPSLMTIGHWMTLGCTSAQSSWGLLRKVANNTSLTSSHKMEILESSSVTIGHWMKLRCVHRLSMAFSYYIALSWTMPYHWTCYCWLHHVASERKHYQGSLAVRNAAWVAVNGAGWQWQVMFTETKLRHCWSFIKFFCIRIQACFYYRCKTTCSIMHCICT